MPDFSSFHQNETPRKLEENAKRFVQYHHKIEDHKAKINDQLEKIGLTGDLDHLSELFANSEKVNAIDKQHLENAQYFAQENLPELTDLAMHYATLAGKKITSLEPQVNVDPIDALKLPVVIKPGFDTDLIVEARLRVVDQYCRERNLTTKDLTYDQIFEIQALPEWQAIGAKEKS